MPLAPASREPWDGGEDDDGSLLDRAIVLPDAAGRWLALAATLVVATLLRFAGLDRFALNAAESDIALTAYNLVRGESAPNNLFGAPFSSEWTGLFLFAGGYTDSIARLAMAAAGVLLVVAVMRFGRWLGPSTALTTALLLASSPTLVAVSRRIDGGALLALLTVAVIAAALLGHERGGLAWPALAGVASALLALSGPLGLPALLLAWFAALRLTRPAASPSRDAWLTGVAAGIGALVLSASVFLTRPASFTSSLVESLQLLWNAHVATFGSRWWMPALNLIVNEPLLLALALVALIAAPNRQLTRDLGVWLGASFVTLSLLGDVGVAGYALVTLPLAFLAGVGAAHLVERLPWGAVKRGPAALYIVAVLLLGAAALSLFGLLDNGVAGNRVDWVFRFVLVVGVAVLPLVFALSALGQRVVGHRGVLVLSALLVVLAGLTVRSSVLAASERIVVPGDPLSAGSVGEGIPIVVGRLERVSRDLTVNMRNSQDPTGGHGLSIALDIAVAQPFRWYFREYPNVAVFDPASEPAPLGAQAIFLAGERDANAVAPGYRGQTYLYRRDPAPIFVNPDWGGVLSGLLSPADWRRFAAYMIDRDLQIPPAARDVQLVTTTEIADRLFPATGPFNLDDRPGAGAGQGQLNCPRGIAIGADGTTYVVDSRNTRVNVYGADGTFQFAFGSQGSADGQFARFTGAGGGGPGGIAIGGDGNLYVADTWNHRVQVFTPDGKFVRAWGSFFDAGDDPAKTVTNPGMFYGPRGIAYRDGLVYVTDTGNERVQVFREDGTFVRMFGVTGSGSGQLLEPVGIAVAADGTVLVADSHNARIARFAADGSPLAPWVLPAWQNLRFFEPYLALGPDGTLYATASQANIITPIGPDGSVGAPLNVGEARQPFGIAVTPDGAGLLVTDGALSAVVRVPLP